MKNSEIIEMSTKELVERLDTETDMFTRLKMNHAVSPLDNPLKLRHARRNIARMKTELRKRQLSEKSNS
jgi:large subunit ribosomal protein L29